MTFGRNGKQQRQGAPGPSIPNEPRTTRRPPPYALEGKADRESATPVDPAVARAEPEWIVRTIVITRRRRSKKGGAFRI